MLNLAVFLDDSVRRHPHREALVCGDRRLTYAEVGALADRVAGLLVSRGIRPGDRVAITCPNLPEFVAAYYGILKAGAVVVPLNVLLKEREIAYHLNDSGARAYFCFEGSAGMPTGECGRAAADRAPECANLFIITSDPEAASPIEGTESLAQALDSHAEFATVVRESTDTAVILYTSGTTGQPKGAELSHANMVLNALTANQLFDSTPAERDTHLVALPLFHSFGQSINMNAAFSVGARMVLMPRFEAGAALDAMALEGVTVFAGVPTMYWGLLDAQGSSGAENLRLAISGGAALPVEIHKRFEERFGVRIHEGYGLSETSPLAIFSPPGQDPRPGSIGLPVWGIEVELVDEQWNAVDGGVGEIAIRGHNVMKGYLARPEATAAVMRDGWFRTGDLARRDADGFYYIVDRAKDMIVRSGFNVYPREVEEVLMSHEAVSLAAVVGVAHDSRGEEIKAFVIRADTAHVTEAELIAWSREQLANYKYPRLVEFVDSLPMTATGKVLKRELGR
ncbi:long-chain acyl-CoA synthetase [Saccharopolyspora antimicrobica]|uniref:Long-chain acyl-CoA synthetase n=1 Tax=Saccharopolyspora antimicrobica TaxID=455193 RepID=A0A1I5JVX0_9PSEU|nr:long-chain fatty acid--CoA ligase [Saccharopolyspora antimicrobica]RKT86968.1 long-chain acyl-CoA synthetase [Saccharopolyspora antimicrobica]SFO76984.1 long-chain acyl-CoA synthetase [Saccharopolyspora antimicrobica]